MRLLEVYSNPSRTTASLQKLLFRSVESTRPEVGLPAPMGRARQLRTIEIDEVVDRYLEVKNVRQVAREFRVSRATVARHLNDRDIPTSRGMNDSEQQAAVLLYEEGKSSVRIGKALGFDNHTILNALRNAGVKIRPAAVSRPESAR